MDPRSLQHDGERDWTKGPAKWIAAVVLGLASLGGMAWSIWGHAETSGRTVSRVQGATKADARGASGPEASAPAARDESAEAHKTDTGSGTSSLINVNTATAAELELLPGIGPSLAQRIVEHREKFGAFQSVDELDRVKGIGARTIERLRSQVRTE